MSFLSRRKQFKGIGSQPRTVAWTQAAADFHNAHDTCEMCGSKEGSLNVPDAKLDGATGDQCNLEAHDVLPYHKLTTAQQNDYDFILANFIMLHHFEHHRFAHGCDPECWHYNPNIRQLAALMLAARSSCVE
jgi:hypothetical protein